MKQTIILICKGEATPMKAIIELLSRSGVEIEHASSRAGGKTHIEIGTPQDLEDVPLPKEVRDLKLSPEQEAMFKLLLDLDKKGDTTLAILRRFETYEKRDDKKKGKTEPEKKKGAAPTVEPQPENEVPKVVTPPAATDPATHQAGEDGASAKTQEFDDKPAEGLAGELAEVLGKTTDETQPPEGGDVQA